MTRVLPRRWSRIAAITRSVLSPSPATANGPHGPVAQPGALAGSLTGPTTLGNAGAPRGATSMDASCYARRLWLIAIVAGVGCGGNPASKPPPTSGPEVSAAPAAGAYRPPLQVTLSCVGHD